MKIVTIADPPEHGRLRRPIVRGLGPRVLAVAQPTTERLVREHIEAFGDADVIDLVPNFSLPVPARLIAGLLGVPEQDQAEFSRWSHDIVAFLGGGKPDVDRAVAAERALSEFRAYLRELIAEARTAQRDDMMGILMRGSDGDAPLNDEELMATAVTLVFAGHETTANIVSNAVLALLEFPDQLEALRADPSLTEAAIEEALRYNGSVQRVRRVARDDVELEGQHIAGGDILLNFLGSANRDPRAWDEADRFDLSRSTTRHLGFGYGPHFCVGSALARMEAPIMLGALLERYGVDRPRGAAALGAEHRVPRPRAAAAAGELGASPAAQRSSWMRIRLPAGSRKAQSRTPYGWSIGSWTTSASPACSRSKVASRSAVARMMPA